MSEVKKEKKEKKDKSDKKEKKDKKAEKPVGAPSSSAAIANDDYAEDYAKNQAKVEDICKTYPNNNCADCNATGTRWASVNHGVFVCIRCSGIHRSMGVHISKVKSSNMDKWTAAEVNMMEAIGNRRGKELYEANLPKGHKPFTGAESDNTMRDFIQKKYADKAFATAGIEEILKKIGKSTGYTSKSGRPKNVSGSADAPQSSSPTGEAPKKAGHSDPMSALFGKDSILKSSGASKKEKKSSKQTIIDGVFGPCTCSAEQHDEKRRAVLSAFGIIVPTAE